MALIFPNVGEALALKAILNFLAPQDQVLKLYQNNISPGQTDVAGTYTEATFTGYSSIALTGTSWVFSGGNPESAAYAQQTFTSSANQSVQQIYGYYVVQASSGTLLFSEKFANGPYPISNNGDTIKVTPTVTAQ